MALDGTLNTARRVSVATYEYFETCLARVPEPARTELLRLARNMAMTDRLATAANLIMLLACDLGIGDEQALVRINNASGLGGLHTGILDNIVDNKGKGDGAAIRNVYLAHIAFNFYYDAWGKIREQAPTLEEIREFTEFEVETYSTLFEEEMEHVGVASPFETQQSVASKCAPVKAVILQMLRLIGREDLKNLIFSAVEACAFALLLADDIQDWEEDFALQRFTYPIQAAFDRLNVTYDPDQHESLKRKVARTLFFGPLYHALYKDIVDKLTSTANAVDAECPLLASWLRDLGAKARRTWRSHSRFVFAKATAAGAKKLAAAN